MATVSNALTRIQHLRLPDAAQSLASAGVPVFPCVPGEKRPLTRRGFHDATADLDQVSAWWDRWPGANLAIPTGPASGIDVVDVDIGSTGSVFPAFQRARREGLAHGWAALETQKRLNRYRRLRHRCPRGARSEAHTSALQAPGHRV